LVQVEPKLIADFKYISSITTVLSKQLQLVSYN